MTDAQGVTGIWRLGQVFRNPRLLIPVTYGLVVALVWLFASATVATAITVVGALIVGFSYVADGFRRRS
jgi:hypothetical protein